MWTEGTQLEVCLLLLAALIAVTYHVGFYPRFCKLEMVRQEPTSWGVKNQTGQQKRTVECNIEEYGPGRRDFKRRQQHILILFFFFIKPLTRWSATLLM